MTSLYDGYLKIFCAVVLSLSLSGCSLSRFFAGGGGSNLEVPIVITRSSKSGKVITENVKVAPAVAQALGLQTTKVELRHLQSTTNLPARIEPDVGKDVDISSRVSGRVDKLKVVPGQFVQKGQLLAELTSREVSDLEAQAVAASAKLSTAKALEAREKQIYELQVQRPKALNDARTEMNEAKVACELSKNALHRQKTLYEEKIGAAKDYIAAKAAFESAQMRLEHAEANFKRESALFQDRSVLKGPYQLAQAERITAEKQLQGLVSQLQFLGVDKETLDANMTEGANAGVLKIKAPISGILSFFDVAEGELVVADRAIFKITDLSSVLVRADVPESQVPLAKVGSRIHVRIAHSKKSIPATISFVSEHIDPATRTLAVRAVLPNPRKHLKTGMFAEVKLDALEKAVLAVPKSALQDTNGSAFVFVKSGDQFEKRAVTTGAEGNDIVEITSGLAEGEDVVTQGSLMLKAQLTYNHTEKND